MFFLIVQVTRASRRIASRGKGSRRARDYSPPESPPKSKKKEKISKKPVNDEEDGDAFQGKKFLSQDWCHLCKMGGELLCCTWCPFSYHVECVGLAAIPRGYFSCPQHHCSVCERKSGAVGGMLFRCAVCPCAYCEDHVPPEIDGRVDLDSYVEMEKQNFAQPSSAFYITCSAACTDYYEKYKAGKFTEGCEAEPLNLPLEIEPAPEKKKVKRKKISDSVQAKPVKVIKEHICACRMPKKVKEKLYCICRQPYDEEKFYIGCDSCKMWYHGDCVGVKDGDLDEDEEYTCSACIAKHNRKSKMNKGAKSFKVSKEEFVEDNEASEEFESDEEVAENEEQDEEASEPEDEEPLYYGHYTEKEKQKIREEKRMQSLRKKKQKELQKQQEKAMAQKVASQVNAKLTQIRQTSVPSVVERQVPDGASEEEKDRIRTYNDCLKLFVQLALAGDLKDEHLLEIPESIRPDIEEAIKKVREVPKEKESPKLKKSSKPADKTRRLSDGELSNSHADEELDLARLKGLPRVKKASAKIALVGRSKAQTLTSGANQSADALEGSAKGKKRARQFSRDDDGGPLKQHRGDPKTAAIAKPAASVKKTKPSKNLSIENHNQAKVAKIKDKDNKSAANMSVVKGSNAGPVVESSAPNSSILVMRLPDQSANQSVPAPTAAFLSKQTWTPTEVGNWLRKELGLDSVASILQESEIGGPELLVLTEEDLAQMGVPGRQARYVISSLKE
jgi:hypothetical protein